MLFKQQHISISSKVGSLIYLDSDQCGYGVLPHVVITVPNKNKLSVNRINLWNFEIYQLKDEYFFIRNSRGSLKEDFASSYLCDGIDGLFEFIDFIIK